MSIKYKGQTVSGGVSLPPGGTTDQVLAKASDADGDVKWADVGGEIYSTEETRIGTWIDGKPVYRRVILTTSPNNSTNSTDIFSISSWNVDSFTNMYGFLQRDQTVSVPINMYYNGTNGIVTYPTKTGIMCKIFGDSYLKKPITLVLEYTKTTDQATISIPAFSQPVQSVQIDTLGMALTPAAASAATEIFKEKS